MPKLEVASHKSTSHELVTFTIFLYAVDLLRRGRILQRLNHSISSSPTPHQRWIQLFFVLDLVVHLFVQTSCSLASTSTSSVLVDATRCCFCFWTNLTVLLSRASSSSVCVLSAVHHLSCSRRMSSGCSASASHLADHSLPSSASDAVLVCTSFGKEGVSSRARLSWLES